MGPAGVNWEKLFKRYIWDDDRTPYFVPAARMTSKQADYEVFAYTIFLGSLLVIVGLVGARAMPADRMRSCCTCSRRS